MGINNGSYIKESAKTASQRMTDDVINSAINSLPLSTRSITSTAARSLLNIGASFDSIDTFTRGIVDDVIEGALSEFYELASGKDVASARNRSSDTNTNAFLSQVNPSTKLAKSDELEVVIVV